MNKGHKNKGTPLSHMAPLYPPLISRMFPLDTLANFRSMLTVSHKFFRHLVCLRMCICFHIEEIRQKRIKMCPGRSFYLSCTTDALLSPRRKGLPPTSFFAVHPVRDDRGSIRCSTLLPNGKVSVQLLRGSAVWSCPVWPQTKHRRDSGITSDHRSRLHVILTSFEKVGGAGRTQKFHILCNLSPSCRFPVCVFSVQTFGLICLFVSACVFLSNFRATPLLSRQLYCSNQLVTVTTLMQLVFSLWM